MISFNAHYYVPCPRVMAVHAACHDIRSVISTSNLKEDCSVLITCNMHLIYNHICHRKEKKSFQIVVRLYTIDQLPVRVAY